MNNELHTQYQANAKEFRAAFRIAEAATFHEIEGVKLHYWRSGSGERTVVFLHGNSAGKEVFHPQFEHFVDKDVTLLAIDLPGHGCSDDATDPGSQYTIPGYARILTQLLHELGFTNCILVGWSLGGNIALEMAGQGCPLAAMLIMGAPPVGPGAENFDKAYLPATFDTAVSDAGADDEEMLSFAKSIYGRLNPIPPLFVEMAQRTDGRARETMVTHWLSGSDGCDQLDTAASWAMPICVAHGSEEPFVSLPYLENTSWKNLWRSKVHTLNDSAHAPFLENSKAFNSLLEKLVSDVD